jgi:sterol 3beta-glucosyltransferase
LKQKGHSVSVVANSDGRLLAERAGLEYSDLGFSVSELLASSRGHEMLQSCSSYVSRTVLLDMAVELHPVVGPRIIASCANADAILSTETVHLISRSIAESAGIPHVAVGFVPYGRTKAYPSFYADTPELRRLSNLETHDAVERYHHRRLLPAVNALRFSELGLPALSEDDAFRGREESWSILGYSPYVCPAPADWPVQREVTGYWMHDAADAPSPDLRAFVEGGSPPLYVGFGSMPYESKRLAELMRDVAARTGVRVVYATGWAQSAAIGRQSENVFVTGDVSHEWLFPRVMGVLHHGGAGTTGAAIRAGVPSLIAWMIVDQAFWAARVHELGAGLDLGNFHELRSDVVVDAITTLRADVTFSQRAAELAAQVREEHGVSRAADSVERAIAAFQGGMR